MIVDTAQDIGSKVFKLVAVGQWAECPKEVHPPGGESRLRSSFRFKSSYEQSYDKTIFTAFHMYQP